MLPLIWPSCYIGISFFFKGLHTFVSSVYNKTEMPHTNQSGKQTVYHVHNLQKSQGLAPNFASEILVGAPNFASKNINDKYPKLCPLNFRYDPKIGTFSQLLHLVVTQLPKFFHLVGELGRALPQIFPPNLM